MLSKELYIVNRARFYHGSKFCPHGILLGSAFPKPCYYEKRVEACLQLLPVFIVLSYLTLPEGGVFCIRFYLHRKGCR